MISFSTLRSIALTLGLGMTMTLTAACGGGDDSDPVSQGCERLDECNALATGISTDECVEIMDTALENATPSQRSDWETLMDSCLQFDSCDAFLTCADGLF